MVLPYVRDACSVFWFSFYYVVQYQSCHICQYYCLIAWREVIKSGGYQEDFWQTYVWFGEQSLPRQRRWLCKHLLSKLGSQGETKCKLPLSDESNGNNQQKSYWIGFGSRHKKKQLHCFGTAWLSFWIVIWQMLIRRRRADLSIPRTSKPKLSSREGTKHSLGQDLSLLGPVVLLG